MGRVKEKRRVEERRSEKRKSQKKEDADARKGRKVAKHHVFPVIAEPSGQMRDEKIARRCGAKHISKSKFAKHTRFGPLLEVEMLKKCTPLWREGHFEVKMLSTRGSEYFWKLRCRKSARCCGAKHISKSKMQKTDGHGALVDVQMCFRVAGARDCAPCQN